MKQFEGKLIAGNERYAVVVSRFNELVTSRLLYGALDTFRRHGVDESGIDVVWVPGAFEIPLAADHLAKSKRYAAIVCLGAVIQGETTHHEYINHQVASGIMEVGQRRELPVLFGVLTCGSMEQALDRSGGKAGNKGSECAEAAIEMANLLQELPQTAD